MNDEIQLITQLKTIKFRTAGPAIGGIWLATTGLAFPMEGWNDFIVVVMGWWLASILRLLRASSASEIVHFMDGPYAVEISEEHSGVLRFRLFVGPKGGREVAFGEADLRRFARDLASQALHLLEECRSQKWWSPDAAAVAHHLQDLDRELKKPENPI
jgi:hypothetical protein